MVIIQSLLLIILARDVLFGEQFLFHSSFVCVIYNYSSHPHILSVCVLGGKEEEDKRKIERERERESNTSHRTWRRWREIVDVY